MMFCNLGQSILYTLQVPSDLLYLYFKLSVGEVAKMLREKKTYLDIAERTGASTATISRVNRSLNYGNDGYELVFNRMNKKEDE